MLSIINGSSYSSETEMPFIKEYIEKYYSEILIEK